MLNYEIKLSTFIESVLISIHWENLSFFCLYIYLKLTKHNSKIQTTMLSAWLVSMEICPKEIVISNWHLPVQTKIRKENVRTKFETSDLLRPWDLLSSLPKLLYTEAHSGCSQASKMELFAKMVNSFYLLAILQRAPF